MNEWIPLIVATLSLIGSGFSFYFSRQERQSRSRVNNATYYTTLVSDMRAELNRFKVERDECKEQLTELAREVKILQEAIRGS